MSSSKILLVDDDPGSRELLVQFLTKHGFLVSTVATGEHALEVLCNDPATLVLLDSELPGEDGLSLCKRLRASGSTVPVIMVSARAEVVDRILGLEMGADDYVVKPFDPRELLARIGVQLRRQMQRVDPNGLGPGPLSCRFGPFVLDTARRRLAKAGEHLVLTRTEFAVLEALVRHPNQALSREHLYRVTHRRRVVMSVRSIDIQIARLRRLLEDDADKPRYIQTIWGVGYVFFPDPDDRSAAFRTERPPAPGMPR